MSERAARARVLVWCGCECCSVAVQGQAVGGPLPRSGALLPLPSCACLPPAHPPAPRLLWFKRRLPRYATKFIEMCVVLCADHGPCVSGELAQRAQWTWLPLC